jgi:hypothetical protein
MLTYADVCRSVLGLALSLVMANWTPFSATSLEIQVEGGGGGGGGGGGDAGGGMSRLLLAYRVRSALKSLGCCLLLDARGDVC